MPRYVVERSYTVNMDELTAVATRSKAIAQERFPQILWEHSHVVLDADGAPKSFCVYAAPDEEMIREHASQGGFPANRVSEIKSIIDPTTAEERSKSASDGPTIVSGMAGR